MAGLGGSFDSGMGGSFDSGMGGSNGRNAHQALIFLLLVPDVLSDRGLIPSDR